MYIKNQIFQDEDTLLEMLFDFSLGEASNLIKELKKTIEHDLEVNTTYQQYVSSLQDEEEKMELETDERNIRLAELLMAQFDSFKVRDKKFYGVKENMETQLFEMDIA